MAGLPPTKVYLYNNEGKYEREFESASEFARYFQIRENCFSTGRRHLKEVYEFEDGSIAATYKIGREGIKKYRAYKASPYTKQYAGRKIAESKVKSNIVEVYNLDGEKIAMFLNPYFAQKLLNMDTVKLKHPTEDGLIFKIKE